jgi:hypothetical protein
MPNQNQIDPGLEEEIALLRDLLTKATLTKNDALPLEERLAMLDSVGRAAPQLARLLKAQRELASEELDPAALLKQALSELEEEWPELRECKEKLRSDGTAASSQEAAHANET